MGETTNYTPLKQKKGFPLELVKFLVYLGTLIIAITVFIFTSQAAQDRRIGENCTSIERNATRHQEHVQHAVQTFDKIDRTLTSQQELMTKTRETMVKVEVSQEKLVEEVKKLSDEVRKRAP
jgi:septal ring factor EnvC (AmiA/AmiB activator)